MARKIVSFFVLAFLFFSPLFCDDLTEGLQAYRTGDYVQALFFLKKAVNIRDKATPENWYVLIMSEIAAGELDTAISDCDYFMATFPNSTYFPYIQYQQGRILHFAGLNDKSILTLSDFCHTYPENEMFASGLYWIAEGFFCEYDFESAKGLYERILVQFPNDDKAPLAKKRLEDIASLEREDKLLYLLKLTGQEYLNAKEDYERQLKLYQADDLQQKAIDLSNQLEEQKRLNEELQRQLANAKIGTDRVEDPEVMALKRKAASLQVIMDQKE